MDGDLLKPADDLVDAAEAWLRQGDAIAAADALGAAIDDPHINPKMRRAVLYGVAAILQKNPRPITDLPPRLRRLMRVPDVGAEKLRGIFSEMSELLDPFAASREPQPDLIQSINGPLFVVCMTPRSGSTFLARCLNDAKVFGRPGEYLHRNSETAIAEIASKFRTPTLESYTARVIYHSQTANGVCGIKTDLGSILSLVIEGTLDRLLPRTKFIYLTRSDLIMQAISLARARITGAWSSRIAPSNDGEYQFEHIFKALNYTTNMMARWESFFALHGIDPLRITYEAIDRDVDTVIAAIAAWIGIPSPARQFKQHRETVQRDAVSGAWRDRFLGEFDPQYRHISPDGGASEVPH